MKDIFKLKESQLKSVIESTIIKVLNEDSRETRNNLYKTQIEKEFPGSLDKHDGRTPYDEYYLTLVNNKKEQDKIDRREASKLRTAERNSKYKDEYGERDKEIRKQNIITKQKEIISDFVGFLPNNLPRIIEQTMKEMGEGKDTVFYYIIGSYIGQFSKYFFSDDEEKGSKFLSKLIIYKYEDYFLDEIDAKYGVNVMEW